eukprot:1260325-Pyramimonas_sp.AAC.2
MLGFHVRERVNAPRPPGACGCARPRWLSLPPPPPKGSRPLPLHVPATLQRALLSPSHAPCPAPRAMLGTLSACGGPLSSYPPSAAP